MIVYKQSLTLQEEIPFIGELKTYTIDEPFSMPPIDNDNDTASIVFLISLSVTFALLMMFLVAMAAYVIFCGADEAEYDEETGEGPGATALGIRNLFGKKGGILLDSSFSSPGKFDDDVELQELEKIELPKLSSFEVEIYQRAKEYQLVNPPIVKEFGTYLSTTDRQFIKDRGIQSYCFYPSINDNVDEEGNFLPSFIVQDKLDVTFKEFNKSASTLLNYPLPFNKKDAVYFEVKVFRLPENSNSIFSIGLVTCPYPYFRIPGMSRYSIAYESTGKLRINNPFQASTLLPRLQEGDVVGFGYRYKLGTIFITHNGKKMMDVTHDVGIDLFVSLGCLNASYTRTYTRDGLLEDPDNVEIREALSEGRDIELPKNILTVHDPYQGEQIESDEVELHVNLGQIGFVFIEANVKKYSFGSVLGEIGIPPSYNGDEIKNNAILQKGDDLPPIYFNKDSDSFFGNIHINKGVEQDSSSSGISGSVRRDFRRKSVLNRLGKLGSYERGSSAFDQENNFYEEYVENSTKVTDTENIIDTITSPDLIIPYASEIWTTVRQSNATADNELYNKSNKKKKNKKKKKKNKKSKS